MKVLVTGGAGYIGSHVVMLLCDEGHDVVVLDDLSLGTKEAVDKRALFIEGSILNNDDLSRSLSDVKIVIHLAAYKSAGESMQDPQKYSQNNVLGSKRLISAMIENKIKNIIFSSSAAVYGAPEYLPLDEKHPLKPINHYGYTKLQTEKTIYLYGNEGQITFANLRYFNAAGYDARGRISTQEKNPANLIPSVMEVATGIRDKLLVYGDNFDTVDGTGIRDYVHVSDLARAHLAAIELISNNQSATINLGSEKQYSVMDVIRMTEKITGKEIPYEVVKRRDGDPDKIYASSENAKNILKWSAKESELDNIIETTWRIYK
tara:strand:+ start:1332 stop:2288 length:957 start_codon:yes stop_codon:yes gene_type:complete